MNALPTPSSLSNLFPVQPEVSFLRVNGRATRPFPKTCYQDGWSFIKSLEPWGPHMLVRGLTSVNLLKFMFVSRKMWPAYLKIKKYGYCCNWNLCRAYQNYVKEIHTLTHTRSTVLPKATPEPLASSFKNSFTLSVVVPWAISCKLNFLH